MRHRRIVFVMTGFQDIHGGIAAVNRAIVSWLKTVGEKKEIALYSYWEKSSARPSGLAEKIAFYGAGGSKLRLCFFLLREAAHRPRVLFGHVTLAVPLLPLMFVNLIDVVIFTHGSEAGRRMKRVSRMVFKKATLSVANSHYTLAQMRGFIGVFSGVACPLGLPPEVALNASLPEEGNAPMILEAVDGRKYPVGVRALLLVGRMHPTEKQKGRYPLLRVLPLLLTKFPDVQLIFPGTGDDASSLEQYIREQGVASSVFMPGHVSSNELQELYKSCYAYVMPSKQEGFGLVYLEAMNYAKPCVGCHNDGAQEVIVHGETGYLVADPNDQEELLSVLCTLLQNPKRAHDMGVRGFERLHSTFSAQHYQKRLSAIFTERLS